MKQHPTANIKDELTATCRALNLPHEEGVVILQRVMLADGVQCICGVCSTPVNLPDVQFCTCGRIVCATCCATEPKDTCIHDTRSAWH
jgi:hypothetical protein